jgi:hypothetical protein
MDPALENVNVHGLHAVSDGCQEENRFSLHFHVPKRLPAENRLLAAGRSAEIGRSHVQNAFKKSECKRADWGYTLAETPSARITLPQTKLAR